MAEVRPRKKNHASKTLSSQEQREEPALSKSNEIFADLQKKIQARFQTIKESKKASTSVVTTSKISRQSPKAGAERFKQDVPRGKKRDNRGTIVDKENGRSLASFQKDSGEKPQGPKRIDEELQKEIIALGGTSDDFELLNGAESDSEVEGAESTSRKDKDVKMGGLEKGISNILKEISLVNGDLLAPSESEVSDNNEGDEDDPDDARVATNNPKTNLPTPKPQKGRSGATDLKCQPRPDWYGISQPDIDLTKAPKYTLSQSSITQLHDHARTLLDIETEAYKKDHQSASSHSFYNAVIASGTLSDRISALTLAVQESPVHNVKALESLVGLAKKRSRAQAVEVLRALKDLFAQGSLLPADRRLYTFGVQPALLPCFGKLKTWDIGDPLPKIVKESHLITWAFEHWLKDQYFEVLKTLEIWCNDEIEFSKSRAVSFVFELLREKPEQESNLLRLLINKLGDPVKKIASQTSYLTMQLLSIHPAMKGTVVSAIEADFIFRPGQSLHGKYYAAVTLNQTALSNQEQAVAVKLLDIYFGLFVALLKPVEEKKTSEDGTGLSRGEQRRLKNKRKRSSGPVADAQEDDLREKLISAVLTGVNRAYPYADKDGHDLSAHLDTLFKITHSSNFNTSIQAMMLIQQMSVSHQNSADRFYRTLYESLLDPRLATSSKQQLYLNLLHRSLKADLSLKRIKAFVKRVLQILTLHEPSFICGAFFLLSDLQNAFPGLQALLDQSEENDQDEEEVFRDVDDEPAPEDRSFVHPDRRNDNTVPPDPNAYDPHKRDPLHSKAENSCAWEMLPFLAHFHPSVTISCDHLLRNAKLPGKPDLTLHSLSHFLDRFVYRNPKLGSTNLRGSSIMQPMASDDVHAVLINASGATKRSLPVNSEQFRTQKDDQIAAEDVFFHKYFSGLGKEPTKKKTKKIRGKDGEENDSVGDEEDEVWKAMMDSAPALEGEGDTDDDLGMSDLESDFDDDEEKASDGEGDGMDDEAIEGKFFDASDDEELLDSDDDPDEEAEVEREPEQEVFRVVSGKKTRSKDVVDDGAPTMSRERKRKMKALPVFASASDYAKMLEDDADEDMG